MNRKQRRAAVKKMQARLPVSRRLSIAGCSVNIRAAAGDGDKQPTFDMVIYTGGKMMLAGWYDPVIIDVAGIHGMDEPFPILMEHDTSLVVGQAPGATINTEGHVVASGTITAAGDGHGASPYANEIVHNARNGFLWKSSIGATAITQEIVAPGATAEVNGKIFEGPAYIVRESRIDEASIVAIGADSNAKTGIAASQKGNTDMTFKEWLRQRGLNVDDLTDTQATALRADFDAVIGDDGDTDGLADEVEGDEDEADEAVAAPAEAVGELMTASRKARADELDRMAAIEAAAKNHKKIAADAIRHGWSIDKTKLEVIRASRPSAPAIGTAGNSGGPADANVVKAALCRSAGHTDVEKNFTDRELSAADRDYPMGLGIKDTLLIYARQGGYNGQGKIAQENLRTVMRAAFSTMDLPGIFGDVAHKASLQGFESVDDSWREIAAIGTVSDFKEHCRFRLSGDATFEPLGPDGRIKHGTLVEVPYGIRAETRARMYGIDRQMILDDDIQALGEIPRILGMGAADSLSEVLWTEFLADHGTFFTEVRGNLLTGDESALGVGGMDLAVQLFDEQVKPNGKPLNVRGEKILVPPALKSEGQRLYDSRVALPTQSTTGQAALVANTHAGLYTVVMSPYLKADPNAWYLVADPKRLAMIEAAFLNGRQSPVIETADPDFDQLGIQMRGYFDFGVRKQEYRAAVKCTGVDP